MMTMKNLLAALSFIIVCMIGAALSLIVDNSCSAIQAYSWSVQFGLGGFVLGLGAIFIRLLLGLCLFLILRYWLRSRLPSIYEKIKLGYFALLPLLVFFPQFNSLQHSLFNGKIEAAICAKSSYDGMITRSNLLEIEEYRFLQHEFFLLPPLPTTADSIDVIYYHDNFLGDYRLTVSFACDFQTPIENSQQHWSIMNSDPQKDWKRIVYSDSQN
jgi:hypothetical protein